jgi:hypothetical protein
MENIPKPREKLWKRHEAKTLTQKTIEGIIHRIHWENEYREFLTAESYNIIHEPVIETLGEALVCVIIAQRKAMEIIEEQNQEDIKNDINIQIRDMLSKLKLENGLLIDPRAERRIIDHYNRPRRLREKFRSQILDIFLSITIARIEFRNEQSYKLRRQIFPYLPPYDFPPR